MSGTSLDGLDLALCEFDGHKSAYGYTILKAQTIEYSADQKRKLADIKNATALQYFALNHLYGKYIAGEVNKFLKESLVRPDIIASHGHTVFHQPQLGFSTQIGCGATIAALTGITTVCDMRSLDVANGGQGAPLVPIGDKYLFGDYHACLNIGGIANISFEKDGQRLAYDVCFANMALNFLAEKLGKQYDENGRMAENGVVDESLLRELKKELNREVKISLAREQFEKILLPVLFRHNATMDSKLATLCAYISDEIATTLNTNELKSVLITGGGAYNKFLIGLIKNKFKGEVIIPEDNIIQFKEALIFAFLGYLRVKEKTNTLGSVTGAVTDSIGGAVYLI